MISKTASVAALVLGVGLNASARSVVRHAYQPPQSPELIGFKNCQAFKEHYLKSFQIPSQQGLPRSPVKTGLFGAFSNSRAKSAPQAPSEMVADAVLLRSRQEAASGAAAEVVGTNNQIAAVDEADFVKFDGKRIYQLHAGTLKIMNAWPANELSLLSTTSIAGASRELLIHGTSLAVISDDGRNVTVTIYDAQTPAAPRELTRFEVPGTYMTARLVGSTLRIVSRDHLAAPVALLAHPSNPWIAAETSPQEFNIRPTVQVLASQRRTLEPLGQCQNVYVPQTGRLQAMTRLISIDLDGKKFHEALAFVNPTILYASEKALYLAESTYGFDEGTQIQKTYLHKFGFKNGETLSHSASGEINGHLINSFAMDENSGDLRVATNGAEMVRSGFWNRSRQWTTVNRVQVLRESGRRLAVIGKTKDLAPGERLYSVRFDGERGYVVTFRQVDPLFTLDLSNPRHPRAVGELKVPGFSTYIHMLDEKNLLTIGQDADPQTGRPKGLKLSVFDVSDFKNPKEVKSLIFKAQTQSEASYEHKAFSFHRSKGALAIPVNDGHRSALLIFKVTPRNIEFKGEMAMTGIFAPINQGANVRRSFFADEIVYAVGDIGVKAAAIFNPSVDIGSISFLQQAPIVQTMEW